MATSNIMGRIGFLVAGQEERRCFPFPPDAQAEIAKQDERIAELEADQDKANAAVAIGNYLGKTYNYAWCDTSLASQTIDLLKEQAAEISRLKALVGECEKKLRSIKTDVDSAPHIPISMTLNEIAFSVEEAIAAIKEEGL